MRALHVLGPLLAWASVAVAAPRYSPMQAEKFLVAGSSDEGYLDGEFWHADFDHPQGLALSSDSQKLYVADPGNHAIRSIELGKGGNAVTTRIRFGKGGPGDAFSLAEVSGDLIFVPSSGKGLWRLPAGAKEAALISGDTFTAGSIGAPVALTPMGKVFWLEAGAGGPHLASVDVSGTTRVASKPIAGLAGLGPARLSFLAYVPYAITDKPAKLQMLDITGGLGQILAPVAGQEPVVTALTQSANIADLGYLMPADPMGPYVAWHPKSAGIRMIWPTGLTRTVALHNTVGVPISDALAEGVSYSTGVEIYPWMSGQGQGVFDRLRSIAYFSDSVQNRVVGWKWKEANFDESNYVHYYLGPDQGVPKDPDVTRMVVICDSMFVYDPKHAPFATTFYKQFELNLNYYNAINGTGKRYDVGAKGGDLGIIRGTVSWIAGHSDELTALKADEVVGIINTATLFFEMAMLPANSQDDDLVKPEMDAEWPTLSRKERMATSGPLTKEFYDLVEKEKKSLGNFYFIDGKGMLTVKTIDPQALLSNTKYMDLTLRFEDKMLAKLEERAKGLPYKIRFMITPFSYGGGSFKTEIQGGFQKGEGDSEQKMDEAMVRLIKAHGFEVVDLIPPLRAVGLSLAPFFAGDDHFMTHGHEWMGRVAAEEYVKAMLKEKKADEKP